MPADHASKGILMSFGPLRTFIFAWLIAAGFACAALDARPIHISGATLTTGTVGVPYSQALGYTGGTGDVTWSVTSGSLPAGLSLSSAGVISGTPTAVGASLFTVQVKDAENSTDTQPFSITILPGPVTVTTSSLANGTINVPYSQSLSAAGGAGGYTWSLNNGSLPAGLSLDAGGGISGTPTTAGTAAFTVQVRDSLGATATRSLSITIAAPPLSVTTTALAGGTVGVPYSQQLTATGGTGGYTWSVSGGSLPAGLSLSASGGISGTPTTAAASGFTVQVRDSSNTTASQSLSIAVAAPSLSVTTTALPGGTVGAPYSQQLTATGGTGGYTWSVSGGSLPAGLSLSASGAISGTPTTPGAAGFTVQVRDSSGVTASQSLSITVAAPTLSVTTTSLSNGAVGAPYSQQLNATGGTGGYTWSVSGGSLPAGLSLSASGAISGTPTAAGPSSFTVQVRDSSGATASQSLSITVASPTLSVTTSSLPNGAVGTPYSQLLSATGGTGGYTWSLSNGSLPAGLSLSAGGAIGGAPTAPGTAGFTVQVQDGSGATATQALSITVAAPVLTVTTTSLSGGTVGTSYSQSLSATGGTGGYTWSISAGSLPAGLSLAASGAISGTPTAVGTTSFTAQVKDSSGATATQSLSIAVAGSALTVTTTSLPGGTVGTPYSQSLSATGGSGGYTWSVSAGSLPAGLSLAASGAISGTPTAAGTAGFTVQVMDSSGATTTQSLSITVAGAALTVTTTSLPGGTVGTPYSQSLSATGGSGGYTWSVSSGSLPAGLSLAASGAISGTPTAAGTASFTAQVKDSSGATATQSLGITVAGAALTVTSTSLPGGTVGTPYSQSLSASGGSGGYTWSVSSGSLPAGLSLASSGAISGTPTAPGTAGFTVQVKDSSNATATQSLSITVAGPALSVTTTSLPGGNVAVPYSQSLSASGGSGGYTWSVSGGSLPAGLSLASSGTISGTPTAPGTAGFAVQVKDSSNATATQSLSIAIAAPALNVTTSSLGGATVGTPYSQTLSATGGAGPYSWSVTSGALPQGLSLTSGGVLSGTPASAGTATFTATVSDGTGNASHTFTINVAPALTITTSSLPAGRVGAAYSQSLQANGGTPPYAWSLVSGQLPPGLTLLPQNGIISGTPTTAGIYSFRIRATDSGTAAAEATFSLSITGALSITTNTSLATGSAGSPYSQSFAATGGTPPYSWSETGALPAGLTFSTAGVLSGTPTQVGTFPITVQVTDASGLKATGSYSVQVVSGLAIATAPVLPPATAFVPYSYALQTAGGSPPYSWVVTAGSLPAGLTFSGSGQITGSPTSTGDFSFTAQVTDGVSRTAQKDFTLSVKGPLSITSAALPSGVTGSPYSQTLTAAGGAPPYSWSVASGSLPPGLTLEIPTGVLAGTPTAAGSFTFTVRVTDSNSVTAQEQLTVSIGAGLTLTTPAALPSGTAGAAYTAQLKVTGGQAPYTWSLAQGSLPAGLSLNGASGVISGVPTAPGTYNFTIGVSDSVRLSTTGAYTIQVGLPNAPALSIGGLPGTLQPLQQPPVTISLANPYPVPVTGTVSLTFTPGGPNPMDDPSVQFSTGGRSATFTIPANATQAVFAAPQFALQAGSVTGTITVRVVALQAGGAPLDIPSSLTQSATVAPGAPVISTVSLVHTQGGVQVQIVGLTDTRELTKATVTFQPAAGTSLQNSQAVVALTDVANGYFQAGVSAGFGGQFALTMPFTFQGDVSLSSVSVVLSNTRGDSPAASANY